MQDHTSPSALENAIALQKYGVGQPVRRKEDDTLVRGKGKYTDDFCSPQPGLCLDRTLQPRPWRHPRHRYQGRPHHAGRARRMDREGPRGRRLQPLHLRPAAEKPRRRAAVADQPYGAGDRQGALCRRSRGFRRRRNAGAGARCGRSGRTGYRAAARRDQRRGSNKTRRAAALRPHPEQCRARLSLRRCRQDRRGICRGRACDKARHRQHPRRRGVDGAARGAGVLRQGQRALHDPGADPGRCRQQGQLRKNPERAARKSAHPDRQCRRLVRHEEHELSRIYLHRACREGAGPPGEVDRRALHQLPVRQPRPVADHARRTGARCRRQVPRRAPQGLRQSRRLYHGRRARAAVAQHRQEPRQRLPHAAARRRHQDGADQHHADGRLSRRRPARGQLLHGAADRPRRRRDGHQPAYLAQAQLHQAGADAVHGRLRRHLRQRRFPGRADQGAGAVGSRQLRQAKEGKQKEREAARHRGRLLSRSHRAPKRRTRQDHLRAGWLGEADHRHAGLRPGPRHAVRAGAVRAARRALREDHAAAERQRPRALRQRHRRLALDHRDRNRDRRSPPRLSSPRASRRRRI